MSQKLIKVKVVPYVHRKSGYEIEVFTLYGEQIDISVCEDEEDTDSDIVIYRIGAMWFSRKPNDFNKYYVKKVE